MTQNNNPQVKPGQFEIVIATYGHIHQDQWMSRQIAENIAEQLMSASYAEPVSPNQTFRIVSIRLEDDSPSDPTQGRVIAVCEPVVDAGQPYRPQGMEVK